MDGSKFHTQFLKRVTQGTFPWNYFKIRPAVPEEKIFKELLPKFHFVTMANRVFDGIKFCEQVLKRTFEGTFLPSLVKIGPAVWKEMFKEIVDNAQRTQDHPKSAPWACCAQVSWEKKKLDKVCLWNTNGPKNSHFLKRVTQVFDLNLGKWPWPWYHQIFIHEMCLHTKYELCN